jgi:hypothetical protein
MDRATFFEQLWTQYIAFTPQARAIETLFAANEDHVVNDHVAFRTIDAPGLDLEAAVRCFQSIGYTVFDTYQFPDKHLHAHAMRVLDDPAAPKIFVSALRRGVFSEEIETLIDKCIAPARDNPLTLESFLGTYPFAKPTWTAYLKLAEVSEYAAWLSTMGYRANHFTVSLNHLRQLDSMGDLVALVESAGFSLNTVGGVIKGRPEDCLVQASTLADTMQYVFADGETHEVPTCFYEFAHRYPNPDGSLFQGFVPANANAIFDSTARQA